MHIAVFCGALLPHSEQITEAARQLGRAIQGLTGWTDCYPKSRLAGTLFCGGVNDPHAIAGNAKLQEAYEMGKRV